MRMSAAFNNSILSPLLTIGKCLILSRRPSGKSAPKDKALVVMGNGPSLRQTIDGHADWLRTHDLLAVNFAANTPDFFLLRPSLYVLADPHFFLNVASDANVERLWENIAHADWQFTLWVSAKMAKKIPVALPNNIKIKKFNLTPGDGTSPLLHRLYDMGMAMPRPRNVLIPSIMVGIREGYKEIYLCGADHTWTRTLSVDDENHVVSIQPHFYKDSGKELKRVATEYKNLHLHDVLGSMTIAFRSYFDVQAYARRRGVRILNATPGSMIDAFPRTSAH